MLKFLRFLTLQYSVLSILLSASMIVLQFINKTKGINVRISSSKSAHSQDRCKDPEGSHVSVGGSGDLLSDNVSLQFE